MVNYSQKDCRNNYTPSEAFNRFMTDDDELHVCSDCPLFTYFNGIMGCRYIDSINTDGMPVPNAN